MIRLFALNADAARWSEIAQRLRGATISVGSDIAGALETPGICDAVVFERSPDILQGTVERLLAAGKHILFAGHPGWRPDDLELLLRVGQQAGAQFAIVNPDRYLASRRLIKQQIADHLGPVGLLRSYRWEPAAADSLPPIAGLPARLVEDLDLALWLCGKPVERVYAVEHSPGDGAELAGRYVQVHLGFTPGIALVDYTNRLPPGADYRALSVIGFSGALYDEDDQNMQLAFRGGEPQALRPLGHPITSCTTMVQEFVDALAAGHDMAHSVAAWRTVFDLADAVNRSLASGQAIAWEGG